MYTSTQGITSTYVQLQMAVTHHRRTRHPVGYCCSFFDAAKAWAACWFISYERHTFPRVRCPLSGRGGGCCVRVRTSRCWVEMSCGNSNIALEYRSRPYKVLSNVVCVCAYVYQMYLHDRKDESAGLLQYPLPLKSPHGPDMGRTRVQSEDKSSRFDLQIHDHPKLRRFAIGDSEESSTRTTDLTKKGFKKIQSLAGCMMGWYRKL